MSIDLADRAMSSMSRINFVPYNMANKADIDIALPIGYGQTISQPSTVRKMLHWLDAKPGDKILDIGSGSGWTTALLSSITGCDGQVVAVERIPELLQRGEDNCRKVGVQNAQFFLAGSQYGYPKFAPYERILVSASAERLPKEILDQLKIGGKLVVPVRTDILVITKLSYDRCATEKHQGFAFVPLI